MNTLYFRTFPNDSAGRPDGLRPQHLKDLLSGKSDEDSPLVAITDLVNIILAGGVPREVRPVIFGAVGYVWRRLTAKVACRYATDRSVAMLSPVQLGFGIAGG